MSGGGCGWLWVIVHHFLGELWVVVVVVGDHGRLWVIVGDCASFPG